MIYNSKVPTYSSLKFKYVLRTNYYGIVSFVPIGRHLFYNTFILISKCWMTSYSEYRPYLPEVEDRLCRFFSQSEVHSLIKGVRTRLNNPQQLRPRGR